MERREGEREGKERKEKGRERGDWREREELGEEGERMIKENLHMHM